MAASTGAASDQRNTATAVHEFAMGWQAAQLKKGAYAAAAVVAANLLSGRRR